MPNRPTQVVQSLVRRSRVRTVLPIQLVLVLAAIGIVWGSLSGSGHTQVAIGIIVGLVVLEAVLLIAFLRSPPESDEAGISPVIDSPTEMVLSDPGGGMLIFDRTAKRIRAQRGAVSVSTADVRYLSVERDTDARLLAATNRDLLVLCEILGCTESDRRELTAVARLLARAAAVPFEEG